LSDVPVGLEWSPASASKRSGTQIGEEELRLENIRLAREYGRTGDPIIVQHLRDAGSKESRFKRY